MSRHKRPTPRPPLLRRLNTPTPRNTAALATLTAALTVAAVVGGANGLGDDFTPAAQATNYIHSTEGAIPCPPPVDDADVNGPDLRRPIARPVTPTLVPSPDSTATARPVSARTPQESRREQVGAFSGATQDRSGTPGSSTPTESTRSTQHASQPAATTQPDETTTAAAEQTADPTEETTPTTTSPTDETETTTVEPIYLPPICTDCEPVGTGQWVCDPARSACPYDPTEVVDDPTEEVAP